MSLLAACNDPNELEFKGNYVENFALYDEKGSLHRLHYYENYKAVVFYVVGSNCKGFEESQALFESIATQLSDEIKFFLIDPNLHNSRSNSIKPKQNSVPFLYDEDQIATDILEIKYTNEVIVIDPKYWTITSRFFLLPSDGEFLLTAIENVRNGKSINVDNRGNKGCALIRLRDSSLYNNITYEDVAPIFKSKCYSCHNNEGIGPWAMNSYKDLFGWSSMIREVINTKRMPPWSADPIIGRFKNDISLTHDETRKILSWISNGSIKRSDTDVLTESNKKKVNWDMGEPDFMVQLDEELIPATGLIDYRYQTFKFDMIEDKMLNGVDIKPGRTEALHHVVARLNSTRSISQLDSWINGVLFVWAPGDNFELFPEGLGRRIPKGSTITFQLHYTTIGKSVKDYTKIGLYFSEQKELNEYEVVAGYNEYFKIPQNTADYPVIAKYSFVEDYKLFALIPHMHYRGKSMTYNLIHPDGSEKQILSVPNYSFNWQRKYVLEEPLLIPGGSAIKILATFDNTDQNPLNPNPNKSIKFGQRSTDEMMIGWMFVSKLND